jgi:hypothetical protein
MCWLVSAAPSRHSTELDAASCCEILSRSAQLKHREQMDCAVLLNKSALKPTDCQFGEVVCLAGRQTHLKYI